MDSLQYVFDELYRENVYKSFKPCYKWIAFNTMIGNAAGMAVHDVLNLVING